MFRKSQDINDICREREQLLSQLRHSKRMNMIDEKRNNINNFKLEDVKKLLLDQTYNDLIRIRFVLIGFSTNILEEAFYYVDHFYKDEHNPLLLELDVVEEYIENDYPLSEINDNKLYEVVNEINLLNQDITTLKNSIDLNRRRYVGAFLKPNPYYEKRQLQLIQIDNLDQLELLKRWVDCDPEIYKTI